MCETDFDEGGAWYGSLLIPFIVVLSLCFVFSSLFSPFIASFTFVGIVVLLFRVSYYQCIAVVLYYLFGTDLQAKSTPRPHTQESNTATPQSIPTHPPSSAQVPGQ